MHSPSLHHATTSAAFFSTPRDARLAAEFGRLRQSAVAIVNSLPEMAVLGDDPYIEHLVSAAGFGPHDIAVIRAMACGRKVTMICVPTRIWRDDDSRHDLFRIKREAAAVRSRCVLVPQRWLRNTDRAVFARAISRARDTRYERKDCEAVVAEVSSGCATVGTCAELISRHPDPYGVVLAMAAVGHITIHRTGRLGRDTRVGLPKARGH